MPGTTSDNPTAGRTATVLARDQHCTFPGCRPAPRYTDLDHITACEDGDPTTTANLTSPCHRHHHLKHTGEWTVHRDDHTATTTWTDRAGRSYLSRPPTLPTTTTTTHDHDHDHDQDHDHDHDRRHHRHPAVRHLHRRSAGNRLPRGRRFRTATLLNRPATRHAADVLLDHRFRHLGHARR